VYVGVAGRGYPVNTIHMLDQRPRGKAVLQVQLKPGKVRVEELKERCGRSAKDVAKVRFPAYLRARDIVSRVRSFGAPTPIRSRLLARDFKADREYATRLTLVDGECFDIRDLAFEAGAGLPGDPR